MEITAVQGQKEKIGCKLKKKESLETVAFRAQRKITKKTTTTWYPSKSLETNEVVRSNYSVVKTEPKSHLFHWKK